jgi:two-component sensor histidine kinase
MDTASTHLGNVADNLQLVADLGYGDLTLFAAGSDGLRVLADARPMTAVAAMASSRVGSTLAPDDEPEARDALGSSEVVEGSRRRSTRGIAYVATAYPIGPPAAPVGVVVRHLAQQVTEAPGKMEVAFMDLATQVLRRLQSGPILDLDSGEPYVTGRRAGDGVLGISPTGVVDYASPNSVNIMRLAGVEAGVVGMPASALPGGATAIAPVVGTAAARSFTAELGGRVLSYRTIGLERGALVLVEDITDVRRQQQELRVKEATIREVHHRVKNNLQTIASLLRIQARRTSSAEASRALAEAVERVSSMAVVHEMLAASTEESVDLGIAIRTVVDMVRQSQAGGDAGVSVDVSGETGVVPAEVATSLALVTAELVHNAIEHGIADASGTVTITMRRLPGEVHLVVRDDGKGLPDGFTPEGSANLGLAIVKTVVEDDLRGTLDFGTKRGTTVTVRVPVPDEPEEV